MVKKKIKGSLMTFAGMILLLSGASVVVNLVGSAGGSVLGSRSNRRSESEDVTITSTPTAAQSGGQATTTAVSSLSVTPTATQQVQVTSTPVVTAPPQIVTVTIYVTKEVERVVTETKVVTLNATTETIKVFLKKIGLPVSQKVVKAEPEKVTRIEEVISEREAGEILKDLQSLTGADKSNGEVRLRFKPMENKITTIEAESSVGQGISIDSNEVDRIKNTLEQKTNLRVLAAEGGFVFSNGKNSVGTSMPLLVDLNNNMLTTETSTGIKAISVLPDSAVTIVNGSGLVSRVDDADQLSLVEREDGKVAYQINGEVDRRFLGFFDLKSKTKVDVSAESGRILSTTTSFTDLILNWLAPKAK